MTKLSIWWVKFNNTHIQYKKLAFIHKFNAIWPTKYCWADCVGWAFSATAFNPFKIGKSCKQESIETGSCYCGQWQDGVHWTELTKEQQDAHNANNSNTPDNVIPF